MQKCSLWHGMVSLIRGLQEGVLLRFQAEKQVETIKLSLLICAGNWTASKFSLLFVAYESEKEIPSPGLFMTALGSGILGLIRKNWGTIEAFSKVILGTEIFKM